MVMQCPCFQVVEVSVAYYLFKLRAAYGSFVKLQLHCLIFFLLFLIISLLYGWFLLLLLFTPYNASLGYLFKFLQ